MSFTRFENLTFTTGHREIFHRDQVLSLSPEFHALIDKGVGAIPGVPKEFRFSSKTWPGYAVLDVVWKEYIIPVTNNILCWDARLSEHIWSNFGDRYQEFQKDCHGGPLASLTPPKMVPFMLSLLTTNYSKVTRCKNPHQVAHAITHFELAWAWSVLDRAGSHQPEP